jgi:hypothetical protein
MGGGGSFCTFGLANCSTSYNMAGNGYVLIQRILAN